MGRMQADEFAAMEKQGEISIDQALSWHLSSNHYPPIPQYMLPACKAAIDAANAGEWDREIDIPEGVQYKDGGKPTASALIEHAHLDSFLDRDDEDFE